MRHPAKFSLAELNEIVRHLDPNAKLILDPFAGVGGIHDLRSLRKVWTIGGEIEPEWAATHEWTFVMDALDLRYPDGLFDAVVTSPPYGNRMADSYVDDTQRQTYRAALGRDLDANNVGGMHWGDNYRAFFQKAWREVVRVVKPGGQLIIVVSNHIRDGVEQPVVPFHKMVLKDQVMVTRLEEKKIPKRLYRFGANAGLRIEETSVLVATLRP